MICNLQQNQFPAASAACAAVAQLAPSVAPVAVVPQPQPLSLMSAAAAQLPHPLPSPQPSSLSDPFLLPPPFVPAFPIMEPRLSRRVGHLFPHMTSMCLAAPAPPNPPAPPISPSIAPPSPVSEPPPSICPARSSVLNSQPRVPPCTAGVHPAAAAAPGIQERWHTRHRHSQGMSSVKKQQPHAQQLQTDNSLWDLAPQPGVSGVPL
jgi:hypothetical protein